MASWGGRQFLEKLLPKLVRIKVKPLLSWHDLLSLQVENAIHLLSTLSDSFTIAGCSFFREVDTADWLYNNSTKWKRFRLELGKKSKDFTLAISVIQLQYITEL